MTAASAVEFSEESVLEEARQTAGLSHFGNDGFREGLRVLLETYDNTAGFNEKGRRRNRRRVVQLLATRLRIEAAFEKHPEIRERQIRRPVYLTGLPRTGTSALFNLLGKDPAARPLLLWEGIFPDPLDDLEPGQTDPRLEALRAHYERGRENNPEFTKIHFTAADQPEECVMLLAHTFCDVQMGIEPLMEPYAEWFQKQDLRTAYAYYLDLLKMLDWQRPGDRWLLKSPAHLWALDVLVELFPEPCILLTHRDPVEIIPSYCSMMAALMKARESLNPKELGPTVLEYLARSLERGLEARDRCDPARFLDVSYRQFVDNPMAVVERIYAHFELDLPPEAEALMRDHVSAHPQGQHGGHAYDLAEFGLTPQAVKTRLADYIDRFELATDDTVST
jgi:hypothetical protein